MFGIKMKAFIYFPCENETAFNNIYLFFSKRKRSHSEKQVIDSFIQYDEKFKFIYYTTNREYSMPLEEYCQYYSQEDSGQNSSRLDELITIFSDFYQDVIEQRNLEIQILDLNKIWVVYDEKKKITSIHCFNIKYQNNIDLSENKPKIVAQFKRSVGGLLSHGNGSGLSLQKKQQSFLSKYSSKNGLKYWIDDQILNKLDFKEQALSVTIVNILITELANQQLSITQERYINKFKEVNEQYRKNYLCLFTYLQSLLKQYQTKIGQQQSYKDVYIFIEKTLTNTISVNGEQGQHNLHYFLIKWLQQQDLMNDIYQNSNINKIQQSLLDYTISKIFCKIIPVLENSKQLTDIILLISLLRKDSDQVEIKGLFQVISNEMVNKIQININNYDQQFQIFTMAEIELFLIECQVSLIKRKEKNQLPALVTNEEVYKFITNSIRCEQRILFFQKVLEIIKENINIQILRLAQSISKHLVLCLNNKKYSQQQENTLFFDIVDSIIKEYINNIIDESETI